MVFEVADYSAIRLDKTLAILRRRENIMPKVVHFQQLLPKSSKKGWTRQSP
jgi:hypothetical protein